MTATIEDRLVIGDASVLQEIYAQHGSLIHTIAYQVQGPAADQFTISTFVEAWHNRRDFDPSRGTVQAWLIRRLRSQLSNNDDYAAEVIDRVVVTASLARMDTTRREILLAGAISETGATAELAQRLNLPVGTVKAHLRRGMETLQSDLADSRSDGDASSLADIVRSRRLETEVAHPDPAVWDAIRTSAAADAGIEVDDRGSHALGEVVGEAVPVIPDPFEPLRGDQDRSQDRRRELVELEADEFESIEAGELWQTVTGDAVTSDVATSDVATSDVGESEAARSEVGESGATPSHAGESDAADVDSSLSPRAGETSELYDVPPALQGSSSWATGASHDDPALASDDWDGTGVEAEEFMPDDSMVDGADRAGDEAEAASRRSILESSDEQSFDEQDGTEVEPSDSTGSDPGPITETDWAIARMRPPMEDPVPDRPNMVAIAGVVVALIVLAALFLLVL